MNISFIIGNGFDLNLGLKTTYRNFYDYIEKEKKEVVEENIFFKRICRDVTYWEDFEKMIGIMSCYDKDPKKFCNKIASTSFEFENNEQIDELVKHLISEDEEINWEDFLHDINQFHELFHEYILSQESSFQETIDERRIRIYNTLVNFIDDLEPVDQKDFFDQVFLELKNPNIISTNNTSNVILSLDFKFLNFNYTSTLKSLLDVIDMDFLNNLWLKKMNDYNHSYIENLENLSYELKIECSVKEYHVHADKDSGMFLGVDNNLQLYSDFFPSVDESEFLIKPEKIEEYRYDNIENYKKCLRYSRYIYIYGMSLGETDLFWWQYILSLLIENNSNLKKVILHYYDGILNLDKSKFMYSFQRNKIQELLFKYMNTKNLNLLNQSERKDIKSVKRRIIPVANSSLIFQKNEKS